MVKPVIWADLYNHIRNVSWQTLCICLEYMVPRWSRWDYGNDDIEGNKTSH